MSERSKNLALLEKEVRLEQLDSNRGDVRVLLAYPNRYWVAMSNLGFQTIYKLFCQHPRLKVERGFYPDSDNSSEIRSFEDNRAFRSFDIVAFSVSFETDYLNVLEMIKLAGVELEHRTRFTWEEREREYHGRPLIIGGGAALTLNAEPLGNFFDVIVIGEGEEVVPEIVDTALRCRGLSLRESLFELAKIEGVYVPAFYAPQYDEQDRIIGYSRCSDELPDRITRRYLLQL